MRHSAALDEELRSIVEHAEALLEALADEGDAKLARLRERVAGSIDAAKARLDDLAADSERARERAADALERFLTENPWTLAALAAGLGLVAGWWLASDGRERADPTDTGAS